jgi:outer membrane protein OmpA-like peptidoglycan-associated protein
VNPFARLRPILIFGLSAGLLSACAQPPAPKPVVAAPTPSCGDFSFPIYFETGSDDLTQAARAVLMDAAGQTKGCPVARIEVLGLADADGPAHRNLLLSRRRAAVVAKALVGAGLPGPDFDIEAIGETGARAADGKPDPMRRRTEVVIHMATPKAR